jgi:hypothetical protein
LGIAVLVADNRDKQIGDSRRPYVAECRELLPVNAIKQENAAPEYLPLMDRLEGAGRRNLFRTHHYFQVSRFQFFHAAIEDDAATIDEHQVCQHVLNFFDLMRGN